MKKLVSVSVLLLMVAAMCIVCFSGCNDTARNVKFLYCNDFLLDTGVNITMSKRLPKIGKWNTGTIMIKYKKSLSDLFDIVQLTYGYTKTLYDDYILIETTNNGILYTWGIFSSTAHGMSTDSEFNYILTNMSVNYEFFFPIYTMDKPLLIWKENTQYVCNITIDELAEFYTQHGIVVEVDGNVLTATALVGYEAVGKSEVKWYVTYHSERELSVRVKSSF